MLPKQSALNALTALPSVTAVSDLQAQPCHRDHAQLGFTTAGKARGTLHPWQSRAQQTRAAATGKGAVDPHESWLAAPWPGPENGM